MSSNVSDDCLDDDDSFHSASDGEDSAEEVDSSLPPTATTSRQSAETQQPSVEYDREKDVGGSSREKGSESPVSPSVRDGGRRVVARVGGDDDWFEEQLKDVSGEETSDRGAASKASHIESDSGSSLPAAEMNDRHTGGSIWDWTHDVVSAVGEGISSVVEGGLGLPAPEAMAKLSKVERLKIAEEAQNLKEPEPSLSSQSLSEDENGEISSMKSRGNCSSGSDLQGMAEQPSGASPKHSAGVGGLFTGGGLFSGIVTGCVSGGLDVLESLGKRTFETLTVKDEGRSDRRRFVIGSFENGGQDLSAILKELKSPDNQGDDDRCARIDATHQPRHLGYGSAQAERFNTNFVTLFEKGEGLFHLEGLEMLSKDQEKRTRALMNSNVFEEMLSEFSVEDVSECSTEDFSYEIKKSIQSIGLPYKPDGVLETNRTLTQELHVRQGEVDNEDEELEVDAIHEAAINALATLTASSIQSLHKLAQLIIIAKDAPGIESLCAFTYLLCRRLSFFACKYSNMLSVIAIGENHSSKIDEIITNIFFECSNACHYVRKALELLRPFFKR